MSIFLQVPLYAPLLASVVKMASKAEKENPSVHKYARSKIPISSNHSHLVKWGKENMIRNPLMEIQPSAGGGMTNDGHKGLPSAVKKETIVTQISPRGTVYRVVKSKITSNLDKEKQQRLFQALKDRTKHVTLRNHKESPLDTQLAVFKSAGARGRRGEVTQVSEVDARRQTALRSKSAERPAGGLVVPKPLTPTEIPVAQHNRVKNIKRSLKRPSSRELQSRACQTEARPDLLEITDRDAAPAPQDLGFRIRCNFDLDRPLESTRSARHLTEVYEEVIIKHLMKGGEQLRSSPRLSSAQRAIVVNWLVKVNGVQGQECGSAQVLQSAVRHLDHVLAVDSVPIERVQLLAAACFWLAQKQCAKPRSASSFARHAANAFCAIDLRAAERYVLRRLNWPTIPIVADDFIPYLAMVCSPSDPVLITAAATFQCTVALLDMAISSCTPDIIALASVINCILYLNVGQLKPLQKCRLYKAAEINGRLGRVGEVRWQLLRTILVMKEESCPCREPYVQYSGQPLLVSQRLANCAVTALAKMASSKGRIESSRKEDNFNKA